MAAMFLRLDSCTQPSSKASVIPGPGNDHGTWGTKFYNRGESIVETRLHAASPSPPSLHRPPRRLTTAAKAAGPAWAVVGERRLHRS
jgi:hypothetical protein